MGRKSKPWSGGKMRDVYPINYLTDKHMNRTVWNRRLKDWIGEDPRRGSLAAIGDECWVWRVAERNLGAVRKSLSGSGILLCRD